MLISINAGQIKIEPRFQLSNQKEPRIEIKEGSEKEKDGNTQNTHCVNKRERKNCALKEREREKRLKRRNYALIKGEKETAIVIFFVFFFCFINNSPKDSKS